MIVGVSPLRVRFPCSAPDFKFHFLSFLKSGSLGLLIRAVLKEKLKIV